MRVRNKLNVRQIAGLKAPNVYSDGGGLYLRVRPTGTKSWIFVRVVDGKRRELGLGALLDVSLTEARDEAERLRRGYREGRDPANERRTIQAAPVRAETFGDFAERFMKKIVQGFRNPKHQQQWFSTIRTYAAQLYPMPLSAVGTNDILAVLSPIWLEKPETAGRVRQRLEKILNAAKVEGLRDGENPARLHGHVDQLLPKQRKQTGHHSALPFQQLPPFMEELKGRAGNAARALEFTVLTAARTGETLGMTWSEVDINAAIWTVPAERMKAGEEHCVPLSPPAVRLLEGLKPKTVDLKAKVFHNGRGSSLSNMAMAQVLRRMGKSNITVHGFRSTFRDWAGDMTEYAREDAEMALAHQVGGKTERAYRRGRSLEKRRKMMEDWAAFAESKIR